MVGDISAADEDGALADATSMAALSVIHAEHAWMALEEVEFTAQQYKTEKARPENWSQQLRDAPTFVDMPKLRARIAEAQAHLS
jgi:hypothetical protein